MKNIIYLSCLRFSFQLILSEAVFLIGKEKKDNFHTRIFISYIGYFLAASLWYFILFQIPGMSPLINILYWVGMFILSMIPIKMSYELSWIEMLFVGSSGYAVEHIAFDIGKIIQYMINWQPEKMGVVADNLIFRILIYIFVAAVAYKLIVEPNKDKGEFKQGDYRTVKVTMITVLATIVLSIFYSNMIDSSQRNFLSEVVCPCYSTIACLLLIVMEYFFFRENRLERENETMEKLLQMAGSQQKSSKEAINIINIKCHDLKHQMKALSTISDESERLVYISEMQKAISIYDATYHTGCEALDYILREKTLLADEYKVTFSCMVDGSVMNFIRPADIYALIGNALDNAIESVQNERTEERIISLNIRKHNDMIIIHLENRCSRRITFLDGLPVTDKTDKNLHGIGTQSIRYIVQKYGGEFRFGNEDGMFTLDIIFNSDEH